jgi:hypothetical protein
MEDPDAEPPMLDQAETHLRRIIQIQPRHTAARVTLSRLYARRSKWELFSQQALQCGTAADDLAITAAEAFAQRGDTVSMMLWARHAAVFYASRLGGDAKNVQDRLRLAQAHAMLKDYEQTLKVLDENHPAMRGFPKDFTHLEEIYQHKNFQPDQVHVVLGLDMEKTALKKPLFVPVAWCKEYGKGKVFYTSLGHRPDIWENEVYQGHLTGAIQWLLGRETGDATPNPDLSRREEDIARKVAGQSTSAR